MLSNQNVLSLAFTVDKKHKNYFSKKNTSTKARMIFKAQGFLGSCKEYFDNTNKSLEELGIRDTEMKEILNHLKKLT